MNNRRGVTRDLMAAVYPLLNVAAFTAVSTGGLFHGQAPQGTVAPYAVLQAPAGAEDLFAMGQPGERVRFQLRAVSNAPDYAEALLIIQTAIDLLDGAVPAVANHLVLRLWWEWTQTYTDPELVNGVAVWHAVSQWCALVDQTA